MARTNQKLINYHTSGTTAPESINLNLGEIAVSHDNDSPKIFIKKNDETIAEFVDKEYIDSATIVRATLIVDLAKNKDNYTPWNDGGTDDEHIQNGFLIVASSGTNMEEWYKAEHRELNLYIEEEAREQIFGREIQTFVSSMVPCQYYASEDEAGDTMVYSYNLNLDYTSINGFVVVDQYGDEGDYHYTYNLTPTPVNPLRVNVTVKDDGTSICSLEQDAEYVLKYLQAGKTAIEVCTTEGSIKSYMVLYGTACAANKDSESDGMYDLTGINAIIPQYKGDSVITHKTLMIQTVSDGKGGKGVLCAMLEQDLDGDDFVKTINGIAPDNKGNVAIINDNAIASATTWSSQKLNDKLNGVYKYIGTVYDESTLPAGNTFTSNNITSDITTNSALLVMAEPVWANQANKTISGIKLIFRPGNENVVNVWFRNSENWTRNDGTNMTIDGTAIVDYGYTVDVTTFGEDVHEATITFDTNVQLTDSSVLSMVAVTWGAELADGTKKENEYKLGSPTVFHFALVENGSVFNTLKTGMNYAWNGSDWDALGPVQIGTGILVGGAGEYKDETIESAINAIDEKSNCIETLDCVDIVDLAIASLPEEFDEYGRKTVTLSTTLSDTETNPLKEAIFKLFNKDERPTVDEVEAFFEKNVKPLMMLSADNVRVLGELDSYFKNGSDVFLINTTCRMWDSDEFEFHLDMAINLGGVGSANITLTLFDKYDFNRIIDIASNSGKVNDIDLTEVFTATLTLLPTEYDEHYTKSAIFASSAMSKEERVALAKQILNVTTLPTQEELSEKLSSGAVKLHLTSDSNDSYTYPSVEIQENDSYTFAFDIEGDADGESNYNGYFNIKINDDESDVEFVLVLNAYKYGNRHSINNLIDNGGSSTTNYIKNYDTVAEYEADTTREIPNVCYIEETDEIIYNNE